MAYASTMEIIMNTINQLKMPMARMKFDVISQMFKIVELDYIIAVSVSIYNKNGGYNTNVDNAQAIIQFMHNIYYNNAYSGSHMFCMDQSLDTYKEMREYLYEEYVTKTMENKLTEFDKKFISILSPEKFKEIPDNMHNYYLSIIATFPKVYRETKEREFFQNKLQRLKITSEYVSTIKKRINLSLKLMSKRYIKDKGIWVINAEYDNTSLITYFDSSQSIMNINVGDQFKIRGTVVKQQLSEFTHCKETRLSRVIYD